MWSDSEGQGFSRKKGRRLRETGRNKLSSYIRPGRSIGRASTTVRLERSTYRPLKLMMMISSPFGTSCVICSRAGSKLQVLCLSESGRARVFVDKSRGMKVPFELRAVSLFSLCRDTDRVFPSTVVYVSSTDSNVKDLFCSLSAVACPV